MVPLLAFPVRAQDDREAPEEEREIVIERDGEVVRFHVPGSGGPHVRRMEGVHAPMVRTDTLVDGRRVIRFHTPDGEEVFEFEGPAFDVEHFDVERFRGLRPEYERMGEMPYATFFSRHGEPFGLPHLRGYMAGRHAFAGVSDETRRKMEELEHRLHELADHLRRAEASERDALERELDDVLEQLFEARGQMREEQALRLEEQADRLREEAQALREGLRDRERARRALIEERKRDVLGQPGADW